MNKEAEILAKIAGRLIGMNYNDLTTAERQIVNILIKNGYLIKNDNEDINLC